MQVPKEFREVAVRMHQDIDLVLQPGDDLIDYLGRSTPPNRGAVVSFIDELLSSDLSGEELIDVWIKAGADCSVGPDEIASFFQMLRSKLLEK
jgi:hypothetical protein